MQGDQYCRVKNEAKNRCPLANPFPLKGHSIATFPDDAADLGDLMQRVDNALYEAKKRGRDCVTVSRQNLGAAAPLAAAESATGP